MSAPDDRLDALLLGSGFAVDPDDVLTGRAADELRSDAPSAESDPWADLIAPTGLTDEQRSFVDAASPAAGAGLPAQSLTGDDPFGDLDRDEIERADDDIIDFD